MTPNWEGALSSMFANNATESIFNKDKLNELKMEFEGLGHVLYRHFNYCKDGFIKILNLIDELD